MGSARLQRYLAAAGLSLVTGAAAIGLAVLGVGPLGEVAASVHGAGAALSRGVLSVVMPDDAPRDQAPAAESPAAQDRARSRDRTYSESARPAPAAEDHEQSAQDPPDQGPLPGGPDVGAGQPRVQTLLEPVIGASDGTSQPVGPSTQTSGEQPDGAEALPEPVRDLTAGALR